MVGYVSVPVPDDGFIKRLNLVARFGQRKVLFGNTAEIDCPSVCLLQQYWSNFERVFSRLYIFVFHQQTQIRLVSNDYCSLE